MTDAVSLLKEALEQLPGRGNLRRRITQYLGRQEEAGTPSAGGRRIESGEAFLGENDYRIALSAFTCLRTDAPGFVRDFTAAVMEAERVLDGKSTFSATAYTLPWSPEETARRFHEAYEEFAPLFGYQTRADTRTFDHHSANGKLMIAVVRNVLIEQASPDRKGVPE